MSACECIVVNIAEEEITCTIHEEKILCTIVENEPINITGHFATEDIKNAIWRHSMQFSADSFSENTLYIGTSPENYMIIAVQLIVSEPFDTSLLLGTPDNTSEIGVVPIEKIGDLRWSPMINIQGSLNIFTTSAPTKGAGKLLIIAI